MYMYMYILDLTVIFDSDTHTALQKVFYLTIPLQYANAFNYLSVRLCLFDLGYGRNVKSPAVLCDSGA
jgi:hypothetical protein